METSPAYNNNAHALSVTDHPVIPIIFGDGIGPEISAAMQKVVNTALKNLYKGSRTISWMPVPAGESAFLSSGEYLPQKTLEAFSNYKIGIKGPLTTPVSKGFRSINVALRKSLDLYACVRPVRYYPGISAPVVRPQDVDVTIFRENTEDVYAGIEFEAHSKLVYKFLNALENISPESTQKIRFPADSAIGIKPVSKSGSQRLIRSAIDYAIQNQKPVVTLVHKGNIMKFTEGAFRNWGFELAEREYSDHVYTSQQFDHMVRDKGLSAANAEKNAALSAGKIWINEKIADAAFQDLLLYPQKFSVIATTNLNGDYLSDALAAQVGGIGIAPGANINYQTGSAIFEATHGSAPDIAGKNLANPSSLILSAVMLLEHLGWHDSAELIDHALRKTIESGFLTIDLSQFVPDSKTLGTAEFAEEIISNF